MIRASQNGKNPLLGPSGPHPKPRRTASKRTTPPNSISSEAVTTSAARILFLEQPALGHQFTVELFVLLDPFDVFRAGSESWLERSVFQVFFKLRSFVDFLEKTDVPLDRILRHVRWAEDAAQHQIVNVDTHGFFGRRNRLPISSRNACRIEHGQRANPVCLPMARTLDRVINR